MRMMERFSIIVFSIIVLILSAFTILVSIEIVSIDVFENIIEVMNAVQTCIEGDNFPVYTFVFPLPGIALMCYIRFGQRILLAAVVFFRAV